MCGAFSIGLRQNELTIGPFPGEDRSCQSLGTNNKELTKRHVGFLWEGKRGNVSCSMFAGYIYAPQFGQQPCCPAQLRLGWKPMFEFTVREGEASRGFRWNGAIKGSPKGLEFSVDVTFAVVGSLPSLPLAWHVRGGPSKSIRGRQKTARFLWPSHSNGWTVSQFFACPRIQCTRFGVPPFKRSMRSPWHSWFDRVSPYRLGTPTRRREPKRLMFHEQCGFCRWQMVNSLPELPDFINFLGRPF